MAIKLDWINNNHGETSVEIYRDISPISIGSPPAVLDTLPRGAITYTDTTTVNNTEYYYRVAIVFGSTRYWSDNLSITATDAEFLLDLYPGAVLAFSTRKLRAAYTGDCLRIVRDSDSGQLDIGFDGTGALDIAAIESFCSGTNGKVVTWYDQSEGSNHATGPSSLKPVIATTGVVQLENGLPAPKPVSGMNGAATGVTGLTTKSFSVVANPTPTFGTQAGRMLSGLAAGGAVGERFVLDWFQNNIRYFDGGLLCQAPLASPSQILCQGYRNVSKIAARCNGNAYTEVLTPSANPNPTEFYLYEDGGTNTSKEIGTSYQEIIVWPEDLSGSMDSIATNVNSYFSIY